MSSLSFSPSPMKFAIAQAEQACYQGEVPVGAVVVYKSKIIAFAHNQVISTCDPTAHAEILVLRQASQQLKTPYLDQCDIYVTLEPCAMCAQALAWARIRRLYFGAYDPKGGAVVHGVRLFSQSTCHHHPEIIGGIDEKDCQNIIKNFFKYLR